MRGRLTGHALQRFRRAMPMALFGQTLKTRQRYPLAFRNPSANFLQRLCLFRQTFSLIYLEARVVLRHRHSVFARGQFGVGAKIIRGVPEVGFEMLDVGEVRHGAKFPEIVYQGTAEGTSGPFGKNFTHGQSIEFDRPSCCLPMPRTTRPLCSVGCCYTQCSLRCVLVPFDALTLTGQKYKIARVCGVLMQVSKGSRNPLVWLPLAGQKKSGEAMAKMRSALPQAGSLPKASPDAPDKDLKPGIWTRCSKLRRRFISIGPGRTKRKVIHSSIRIGYDRTTAFGSRDGLQTAPRMRLADR